MLLKRKRSDSEMSSPSYSMSPSPTQSGAIASAPYMSQFGHEITPLHLSSRTRKRVRDNRPSEHQIHGKYPLIRVVPSKQTNSFRKHTQPPLLSPKTTPTTRTNLPPSTHNVHVPPAPTAILTALLLGPPRTPNQPRFQRQFRHRPFSTGILPGDELRGLRYGAD